jgi:chemotaxis protein histidine kinase CheA
VISSNSIASAARALQLLLALQDMGKITSMKPTQEEIESAMPVSEFSATLLPGKPLEDIKKALLAISELDKITIGEEELDLTSPKEETPSEPPESGEQKTSRKPVGEILVGKGFITQEQLNLALENLKEGGPAATLGQTLVSMGYINQETLDEVLQEQKEQQKTVAAQTPSAETAAKAPAHVAEKTVRASVARLVKLMIQVGELITDRNRIYQIRREFEARYKGDPRWKYCLRRSPISAGLR